MQMRVSLVDVVVVGCALSLRVTLMQAATATATTSATAAPRAKFTMPMHSTVRRRRRRRHRLAPNALGPTLHTAGATLCNAAAADAAAAAAVAVAVAALAAAAQSCVLSLSLSLSRACIDWRCCCLRCGHLHLHQLFVSALQSQSASLQLLRIAHSSSRWASPR